MNWVYHAGRLATKAALILLARWEVSGRENVPRTGALLIVSNHLNNADAPLIGASIGRKMRVMAKEELFESPLSRYFISGYGGFPVRRDGIDRTALRTAEQCLDSGMALVMFPEGRRSLSGGLQDGLSGAALMASRKQVPVLPVGIAGTEQIRGKTWWLRRPRIAIRIGAPFRLPATRDRLEIQKQTVAMMEHIAALLPPGYRGRYQVDAK